jgi:D-glycero-D-manno-heptose 1,7-bisphosphate phosphatase
LNERCERGSRGCLLSDVGTQRAAVFLDRDGTIAEEVGYLNHLDRFRMFPFAGAAIRRLNQAGLPVVVVTNQSGVARGYFPESLVQQVNDCMQRELTAAGARVDAIYYCPHSSEDHCECRKPGTGMMERAAREHHIDLSRSYMVGDRYGDMELAFRAGCKAIFVRTGYGLGEETWHAKEWPRQPDAILDDLQQAADWIVARQK